MRTTSLIAAVFVLGLRIAAAATLAPGMALPALTLADQHDQTVSLGPEIRIVIFGRDMDAAEIVEKALADGGATLLAEADAVFVSDISGMPGMIRKFMALPAMRRRPYRMVLDRDGDATVEFPVEKGKVTLLRLNALQIEAVEYVDSAPSLRAALETAARQP
jgi:hypothetical protein